MKPVVFVALDFLAVAAAAAPAAVRQGDSDLPTLAGLLAQSGKELDDDHSDFDILLSLLNQAGLVDTLNDPAAEFTVFAPSDAAFTQSLKDLGLSPKTEKGALGAFDAITGTGSALGGLDPVAFLSGLLKYHLVPGKLLAAEVLEMQTLPTAEGQDITRSGGTDDLALIDKATDMPDPKIGTTDILASNGVLHSIDRLLFNLPSVSGSVLATSSGQGDDPAPSSEEAASAKDSAKDDSESDSDCFPASSVVHMSDGSELSIADLAAGHFVKTTTDTHSPVFLFTHRQLTGEHEFVRLDTASGHFITLSAGHYLYANGVLATADTVVVGDVLMTLGGASDVVRVSTVLEAGRVAPHTLQGDIVVNGIMASTYTRSVPPKLAHVILAPLRALVRLGFVEPVGNILHDGAPRLARLVPKGLEPNQIWFSQ